MSSTDVIADEMCDYLEQEKLSQEEQKRCRQGSSETKDQFLIDKTALKDWKKRGNSLSKCMTLFHIAGSMSVRRYLELQVM